MKSIKKGLLYATALFFAVGCDQGIDPISPLDPGPDEAAPQVTIQAPSTGYEIRVPDPMAPVLIRFEASDDIELETVTVALNGNQIASFSEFIDYRRFLHEFTHDSVPTGSHELTITATDLDGKSTSESVAFDKVPPYVPVYPGEIFYMPFDGDFMELNSFQAATQVGTPAFTGQSVEGTNAYAGRADSYLTFPGQELQGAEFSAVFWMNINADPDRAGILVMSPLDPDNPADPNLRTSGFRFFREGNGTRQVLKLNVGTGDDEVWFDGNDAAAVDPTATDWVHVAFAIGADQATVYINGQIVSQGTHTGIDWSGAGLLSIMSGAPRFTGWDHMSDLSFMDELRLFNKVLSQEEIQNIIETESGQVLQYDGKYGEIFYMPFEEDFIELASGEEATVTGNPGFDDGVVGKAYAGSEGAYLTFPAGRLQNDEFSATFWLYITASPDRAGILVMSPEDSGNAAYPDVQNDRTKGFRFFRENVSEMQRFKLNIGTGGNDLYFDGQDNADLDPAVGSWAHFAFTISENNATVYINGEEVSTGEHDGMDWTGADVLTIMSGEPRFTEWLHFSDQSLLDELRIYDKVLTSDEIQDMFWEEAAGLLPGSFKY